MCSFKNRRTFCLKTLPYILQRLCNYRTLRIARWSDVCDVTIVKKWRLSGNISCAIIETMHCEVVQYVI